ncbi:MAG TPA: hypothetical protein PK349_10060 [Candidatus Hydrogenedentes bacterium]|nr:hypothetical protein [Candidatus Hydrogenedentota bacterium]
MLTFRRPRRAQLTALILAGMALLTMFGAQRLADRYRPASGDALLYLPNEHLLTYFTAGLSPVIADMLWLHCIQYVAIENRTVRNFTWLEHMVYTTVRLDPLFRDAYRYGSIFLSALRADAESARSLLRVGMLNRPDCWELPYELATLYLLNLRHTPDALRTASYYLALGATRPDAPPELASLAANIQKRHNLDDIEEAMWRDMTHHGSQTLREMAERKLAELEIRRALPILNERAALFRNRVGRLPETLDELIQAGLLAGAPPQPIPGEYFIAGDGQFYNTALLESECHQIQERMKQRIDRFREKEGRLPESLNELIDKKYITDVPTCPWPGRAWAYDPVSGAFTMKEKPAS